MASKGPGRSGRVASTVSSIAVLALALLGGCLPPAAGPAASLQILAPTGVSARGFGEWLDFDARVRDAHGVALPTDAITWTSDLSGDLGAGRHLRLRLQPGLHALTATHVTTAGTVLVDHSTLVVGGYGGRPWWEVVNSLAEITGATNLLAPPGTPPADFSGLPPVASAAYHSILAQAFGEPLHAPPTFAALIESNPATLNAALGSGKLTAGITAEGTLALLRWPGPGGLDQVAYRATDRSAPRLGAEPGMGSFGAIRWTASDGTSGLSLLHGSEWTRSQTYLEDTSAILVTEFDNAVLGLHVTSRDFVHPTKDLLVRRFEVTRAPSSPVTSATFIYYENLDPCTDRFARIPYSDWLLDPFNDFAAVWVPTKDAILHFRPSVADYTKLPPWRSGPNPAAAAGATFGPGVYLTIGSDRTTAGHQLGYDLEPNVSATALSPLADAADGVLSGNNLSAARAAGALAWPLDLGAPGGGGGDDVVALSTPGEAGTTDGVTVYIAAAATQPAALNVLTTARAVPWTTHLHNTQLWWHGWLGAAILPATTDPDVLRLSRRGLISLRTAIDNATGAIVASVAPQIPYAFDWPRDGAFLNRLLDIAGYPALATKHNLFYAHVQRSSGFFQGTMEMNYAPDGTPGGPVIFEIDNAALAVWSMASHREVLAGAVRTAYLAEVYPAIKRGANFLTYWTDPFSGLPLPANEDDVPALTQGSQGAVSTWLALDAAVAAGTEQGEAAWLVSAWASRRDTLKTAIWSHFHNPATGVFGTLTGPDANLRGPTWAVFPANLFGLPGAPALAPHADALRSTLDPLLAGTPGDYAYNLEQVLALSFAWHGDAAKEAELAAILASFATHVPTTGTGHLGEFSRLLPGALTHESRNDSPHIWEHALFYLSARKVHGPDW